MKSTEATLPAGNAVAVISVLNDLYIMALVKGCARQFVRPRGDVDVRISYIFGSAVGRPPKNRPVEDIAPGVPYIFRHMGFDYRSFRRELTRYMDVAPKPAGPVTLLRRIFSTEILFVCRKK